MTESKNILITVSEGSIARNILHSFVLKEILQYRQVRVTLLVPEDKMALYQKEFGMERVRIVCAPSIRVTTPHRVLGYLARNGLRTETILMDQRTRLFVDRRFLLFFIKRMVTLVLGSSTFFHSCVRSLAVWWWPLSDDFIATLRSIEPDEVFSTDVQDFMDVDVLVYARRYAIPSFGMVRSWDNLTTHGLVLVLPDKLLVWDNFLKEMAVKYQGVDEQNIVCVGIPQYDWYAHHEYLLSREDFARQWRLNASDKIIFYAGIGDYLAPHEADVAVALSEALRGGTLQNNVKVIFRPHPNFEFNESALKQLDNIILDKKVAVYLGSSRASWEMDQNAQVHFMNALYHADIVVSTASTITLDAVAFGKPVICIAFDGFAHEPYVRSVRRYYFDFTHYIEILKTKGFQVVYTIEELFGQIHRYLQDSSLDADGRARILEKYIGRLDGKSGERIAKVLVTNFDF